VAWFSTDRGTVAAVLVKLLLCWGLIGWTGGISSTWYVILLLPVVSAATTLNAAGSMMIAVLACLAYLSFLLFVDLSRYEFTPEAFGELGMRIIFLPVVAFMTNQLAEANRVEARRYQAVAAQLEAANRNLREAEAAVRRSERLAALGQLTAGLAHELRNPLGTIRGSAEMLYKSLPPDNDTGRELTGYITEEVDRTNSLITRFLQFARPVRLETRETDLPAVIDGAIRQIERHTPPLPVSIHRNFAVDTPRIEADAELLGSVVYNLLLNAAQATPPGGTVTVKTWPRGDMVEIAVIDRGAGIAKRNLESIFNPFFTTRRDGVGLGLAIVSKIVDEHGGQIQVESEEGAGSSFRVFLPVRPVQGAAVPDGVSDH
jgi:two-component system, NtrC family, sensor histidine kinase HydH